MATTSESNTMTVKQARELPESIRLKHVLNFSRMVNGCVTMAASIGGKPLISNDAKYC